MEVLISKRIKLDNGKTIIVDMPEKRNGKFPLDEAAKIIGKISAIKPFNP